MPTELTNEERARKAGRAVEHYANKAYTRGMDAEEPDTILTDLLCDLRHWCARNGADFDGAVENSQGHFDEEQADETDGETR